MALLQGIRLTHNTFPESLWRLSGAGLEIRGEIRQVVKAKVIHDFFDRKLWQAKLSFGFQEHPATDYGYGRLVEVFPAEDAQVIGGYMKPVCIVFNGFVFAEMYIDHVEVLE